MASPSKLLASRCRTCFHQALSRPRNAITFAQRTQRCFHTSQPLRIPPKPADNRDRGPASKEDTQTDFNAMDILSNTPAPTTAVDACIEDGFALNSGLRVTGAGVLLLSGEAFKWRPWLRPDSDKTGGTLKNSKGQFDVATQAWGVLDLAWPKPDLLILGTGKKICR